MYSNIFLLIVSHNLKMLVVNRKVRNGFLDQAKYDERHVLAIPDKYIHSDSSESDSSKLAYHFVDPGKNVVNSEETPISSEETPISSEETPISSEETTEHSNNLVINSDYGTSAEARS